MRRPSDDVDEEDIPEELSSSVQSHMGDATRSVRSYGPSHYKNRGLGGRSARGGGRRPSSRWMGGMSGCFVSGKRHRANDRPPREELRKAVQRLNDLHPKSIIIIEEVAFLATHTDANAPTDDEEENGQWAEGAEHDTGDSGMEFIADEDLRDVEHLLSNVKFIHGRTFCNKSGDEIDAMHAQLRKGGTTEPFHDMRFDTCVNRMSITSMSQYIAWCKKHSGYDA